MPVPETPTRQTIEAVWRIEAARLIGGLARFSRDIDRAEDLPQDALVVALERWPGGGIPNNPGAWLMTTAKNLAVDAARHRAMMDDKHGELEREATRSAAPGLDGPADAAGDDVLRLMLIASHPVLSMDARAALTLRLVAGPSTAEIARGFLTTEATMAQRIVRAKRTLAEAKVPFEIPEGDALLERIPALLEVVYLIFNEGYLATSGDVLLHADVCPDLERAPGRWARLCSCRNRTAPSGTACSSPTAWRLSTALGRSISLLGPTRCRRRLPRATLGLPPRKTPTGSA